MSEIRTYDWNNNKDMPIRFPELSDLQMADKVRMLMRLDLNHEPVVCGARDRIMCLTKEKEQLEQEKAELKAKLEKVKLLTGYVAYYDTENMDEIRAIINESEASNEIPEEEIFLCKNGCGEPMAMYPADNTLNYCEPCRMKHVNESEVSDE